MKKSIALLLVSCLLLALAACSPTESSSSEPGPSSSSISSDTAAQEPESDAVEETSSAPQESVPSFDTTATIQETVLYEENGVKITATGLECSLSQVALDLTIENNSSQDLSFSSATLGYSCNAVNGIMVDDGYVNCEVAAGKIANETVSFSTQQLLLYGIDRVSRIQMGFTITDADYNSIYTDPTVVQTSIGESYKQPADCFQKAVQNSAIQSGLGFTLSYFQTESIFDQNGVQVVSSGLLQNSSGEQMLFLEVVNTGEQPVYFSTSDIAFNGLVVHSYNWSSDLILPGARRVVTIDPGKVFEEEFWSAYGMENLGSVAMNVILRDQDGNDLTTAALLQVKLAQDVPAVNAEGIEVYNANGIRIVSKQLAVDGLDRTCALLLVQNTSGQSVDVGVAYDSLSVGGVMTDFSCSDQTIPDSGLGALVVCLSDWEDSGSTSVENIADMEMQLEIRAEDSYDTIDSPKVTLNFSAGSAV